MLRKSNLALGALAVAMLAPVPSQAQLWTWTKEQLTEYTKAWTGERFPDGRPKVSDSIIARSQFPCCSAILAKAKREGR